MLQLARGWQMRSPLKIRREEILHNLSESCDGAPAFQRRPAFTLDPHALFSTSAHADAQSPREDLKARTTWASALAEVMIEDEREDDEVARSKADRWARHHAAIAARIAGASREQKWASAQAAVLADLRDEMAAAAATAQLDREVWEDWLAGSEAHFASMPAISRVQRITFRRLSNAQYPWRVNDLSDMHFLSSAAGYADYLLAENATSHDLRGSERQVPPGAEICRTPGELVDLLEGSGGPE